LQRLLIGEEVKTLVWFIKWLLIDAVILTAAFGLSWWYFSGLVDEEYGSGVRTTTDSDSIMIPVMGVVTLTAVALLCANVCHFALIQYRRRRTMRQIAESESSTKE
jgi:hypothetical protein